MRYGAAVTAAVGVAAGAVAAAVRRRRSGVPDETGGRVHTITVLAPLDLVRDAWATSAGVDENRGEVDLRAAPGDRGTELRVTTHGPDGDTRAALRRLKSRLESGDVLTTEGQPTGRSGRQEAMTRAITDRLRAWGPA